MAGRRTQEEAVARSVRRVSKQGVDWAPAELPAEEPLAIEINGRLVAVLMRTPGDEKALALGYCLSEGLLRSPDEVLLLHHCGSGMEDEASLVPGTGEVPAGPGNRVRLTVTAEAAARLGEAGVARWVFSGCAGVDVGRLGEELAVGAGGLRLRPEVLWGLVPALVRAQRAYRATGGIHAAALADADGHLLALGEDVGRHNAVDKVIGALALRRAGEGASGSAPQPGPPHPAILVATGRASSDIVAKAARVGVPVVASFSSSTSLGMRLAEAAGITLIGYLRHHRLVVYTHPERIAAEPLTDRTPAL